MTFKRFSFNIKYKNIVEIKKNNNRANEYCLLYYYLNINIFFIIIKFYCLNI